MNVQNEPSECTHHRTIEGEIEIDEIGQGAFSIPIPITLTFDLDVCAICGKLIEIVEVQK